jgi:signal transduction histidine kinase
VELRDQASRSAPSLVPLRRSFVSLEAAQNPAETKTARAVQRRGLILCAVVLVASLGMHPLLFDGLNVPVAWVECAWAAAFVLLGVLVGAGRISLQVMGVAAGVVSAVCLSLDVYLSGGVQSPFFWAFYVIPLVMAVFVPNQRLPVFVVIVLTLGGMVTIGVLDQAPVRLIISQAMGFSLTGVVSAYGAQTYRRLLEAEHEAHRARLRALEQLAESEQRRVHAERNRAEIERMAIVGQLASGVAHEVNNPLAFVKANLRFLEEELVERQAPLDREELRSVLTETQQGILRIQQIVTDLRQFSREAEEAEACAVPDAVEEARRLASVRLRSLGEVVGDVPPGLPRIRMGQRQLVQVLLNLLVNAADAVESAQPRRPARIVLRARAHAGGVRLEVEDNGPGIPPEVLPRLFEPFFTTKPPGKGTGLGLALCREYVAQAGGELTAENHPEGGARFILQLALASATPASVVAPAA